MKLTTEYHFTKKHFFFFLENTCYLNIKLGYLANVLCNILLSIYT